MAEASRASTWMSVSTFSGAICDKVPRNANSADTRPRFSVAPPSVTKYDCESHFTFFFVTSRTRALENTGGELAVSAEAEASFTLPSLTMRYGSHMSGTFVAGSCVNGFGKPLRLSRLVKISRPPARLAYGRDWLTQDCP